jgi:adenylate cyclase
MPFWKIKLRSFFLVEYLSSMILSIGVITTFTYVKYSNSINEFSLGTIDRSSKLITKTISCAVLETESLPSLGWYFFQLFPNISMQNKNLTDFFFGVLEHDPNLFGYYIALPDGSYLETFNYFFFKNDFSFFNPVPASTHFIAVILNASTTKTPTILFFDQNYDLLSDRPLDVDLDPTKLSWYQGAVNAKTLYWTDPHPRFYKHTDRGFTAAEPFYDKKGQLQAVIAADIPPNRISDILTHVHISNNGKAYVLDEKGKIFLPKGEISESDKEIASFAYTTFQKSKQPDFSYDFKSEVYLASVQPFPTSFDKHWTIVTVAPRSDFFAGLLATQRDALLLSLAVVAAAAFFIILVSFRISKPIVQLTKEIDRIAKLDLDSTTEIRSSIEEIGLIGASVESMRTALRSFGHYVPKELAKRLMMEKHEIALGGEKKRISIFFTDIDNFTSIAETLPIEQLSSQLTEYLEALTKIITDCGGTIDKYIGDSIMSIWGAPGDLPDFAAKACKAALLCQKRLSRLHDEWRKKGMPLFDTRMAIATGSVFVGNIGTKERMTYSALGDTVNIASRLHSLNKTYQTRIIVGEDTIAAAGPQFLSRPLEIAEVRGKRIKLKIFELVALKEGEPEIRPTPEKIELCDSFRAAFGAYEKGDLAEAKKLFQAIHEKFPEDYPTKLYLERLK